MRLRLVMLTAFLALAAAPAGAFELSGSVYCDANQNQSIDVLDLPLPGVEVIDDLVTGDDTQSAVTDVNGDYLFGFGTLQWGTHQVTLEPATLPGDATIVGDQSHFYVIDDFDPAAFEKDWLIDSAICRGSFCGDGVLDEGEECDDGNSFDGDGCSAECTFEPFCGDGVLDEGEQCDDGNTFDGDGCSGECTFEVGGEGCTPGYWRQSHHYADWVATGYSPGTLFVTAFGVDAFPGRTLGDVVSSPGGGALNQLGFHAVAALLNAASPDVDYDRTPAQVIAAFVAAYASGDYETAKDYFADFNEQGCPLGAGGRGRSK